MSSEIVLTTNEPNQRWSRAVYGCAFIKN